MLNKVLNNIEIYYKINKNNLKKFLNEFKNIEFNN